MQVVQLFRHIPNTTEDDQVVVVDVGRVTTSLEGDLTLGLNLNPLLVCDVEQPEVVELFRAVILATKHVHVTIKDACRMAASRARFLCTRRDLHILPLVVLKTVHGHQVGTVTLLESSKDDHLAALVVNYTSVLVAKKDCVSTSIDHRPRHRAKVQVVKLVSDHDL